jgi:hypothetical protein
MVNFTTCLLITPINSTPRPSLCFPVPSPASPFHLPRICLSVRPSVRLYRPFLPPSGRQSKKKGLRICLQVRMREAVVLVAVQNLQSIAVFLGAALAGLPPAQRRV